MTTTRSAAMSSTNWALPPRLARRSSWAMPSCAWRGYRGPASRKSASTGRRALPDQHSGVEPALGDEGVTLTGKPGVEGASPVVTRTTRTRHFSLRAVERRLLLLVGDAATWWLGGAITIAILRPPRFDVASGPRSVSIAATAALAWWLWAWVNGAYDIQVSSRASSLVPALLRAMLLQSLTFVGLAFFARGFTGRIVWAWWLFIAYLLLVIWRSIYLSVLTLPMFARQIVLAGDDAFLAQLADGTLPRWSEHYRVVGYVDAGSGRHPDGGLPLLGELRALPDLADEIQVREVVVGKDVLQSQSMLEQLVACRNLGIKVTPAAQLYEELTGQVPLSQI